MQSARAEKRVSLLFSLFSGKNRQDSGRIASPRSGKVVAAAMVCAPRMMPRQRTLDLTLDLTMKIG
jgi:hypothetical protein